jgi:hypothetical protein
MSEEDQRIRCPPKRNQHINLKTQATLDKKHTLTQNANMLKNKESALISSPIISTNERQHG